MKIEISNQAIEQIAAEISKFARHVVIRNVDALEDKELIAQIRASQMTNTEKAETYLKLTKTNVFGDGDDREAIIENKDLGDILGLHVLAMKKVRDELIQQGKITAGREDGKVTIRYNRKRPVAPGS